MLRDYPSDDDDHHALITHHEVKPLTPHNNHFNHCTAFEIAGDLPARIFRGFYSCRWGRYVLAFGLPLILIITFFFLNNGRFFHDASIIRAVSPGDRMREAKLQVLYLQNRHLMKKLKSAQLQLTKLNKQIQNTSSCVHRGSNESIEVLSAHHGSNESIEAVDDDGLYACRKVDRLVNRGIIEWKPSKDRFLFAICLSGQMSNHLICLEKHMLFAALLGRVLVLPSHELDYEYNKVLDINHINQCLGGEVAISYDDFTEKMKKKLNIDRFICYVASPPCYLDDEHIKRLKNLGISFGKIEAAWPEDAKLNVQKRRVVADIMPKFSVDDEVIAIGDMFYADVEEGRVMQPGGPISHKCKTLIQPSRLIILTAKEFLQTYLSKNFIALHFRRHGFLKFCNLKNQSCFYPIPQAAQCILRLVERANISIIYLSTDAAESESNLLQSLLVLDGKTVPLFKRPTHNSAGKWDALLYRNHIGGIPQVEAMLDKTISAMSTVFIGTSGSTFSDDILRLRRGWGTASHCDEYLCRGELPNFIAETE